MDFESIRKKLRESERLLDKIEDNRSAIRAIQAGKMIEVRLNPGVPFQGIGLKSKEINDRIKYDVLELLEKQGRDLHEQFERIITVIGEETQNGNKV
ncbi:hypothetical protein HWB74_gp47 [Paenibacillus phage Jacopo]|uniref:Uncharacterized protein n=14 Tax=root TaxID=1 RepID=A0A0K2CYB4_9CAUD|nr:hypothetical protein [Paenibacillus larvae]YP_009197985.1 hypothetical protein AVV25_gp40 [Paenibacillus phage Diva]YP_009201964.1 hypothetical protein XENIA_54 [Paenibacillus phage Xenia]YP_009598569.1 hypothetical protein FDH26_gp46 [Paenibacillus phage Shelly]YP_009836379.1 hypothetical protein HWB44_gp49 [Paenibacillus phage PBL1c]YP_009836459.1 hypothetical protein HWB45_gp50 [Paenibacillus phage Pagassa]YP_009838678.1 hypothetical protein HWB70_gp47 [Paenibacillus phage Yyerffej]YP_